MNMHMEPDAVAANMNPGNRLALAIVDPSSAGYFIAKRALERGFMCIAISLSHAAPADIDFSWSRAPMDSNFDALVALDSYDAIMPGAESGVCLAEELAARLGLAGNDPETTARRRNKTAMAQAVAEAGIAVCRQACCRSVPDCIAWAEATGYPVVVKPEASSGGDLVRVCQTRDALSQHASAILEKPDRYGQNTRSVLIQSFMAGDEYTVDGVVSNQVLTIFAVGKYRKINLNGAMVYDKIDFLAPSDPAIDRRMLSYCEAVTRAVGVRVGPVHIEVMLTANGPLLVEIAARAHGGIGASVIDASFAPSFIDAIIDSYIPGASAGATGQIIRKKTSSIAFLISDRAGTLVAAPGIGNIRSLSSFVRLKCFTAPGDAIPKTVDLVTCPALVELSDDDPGVIEADIQRIRELERSGAIWEIA
ncbi:ATP-grasp domain-containing protein [Verminephrobacter eiseniae]|uniref:ATP-grasp domain-containing protein n=1 Tax=Verminephrobacter eiseniae TaxID=364317 RepID=UPI002237FB21|nr:ATP-grasp domain-containing protein [Verminephrobacter eiseniae]MCW5235763.1 ATP-grasp domain-containing protein [Verminephrobacter eiseniae]